jgi:hypothetical protein
VHRSHGIPGLLVGYEAQSKMKRHLAVLLLAGLSFLQLEGAAIACGSRFGSAAGRVRRTWRRRVVANVFSAFARWTVRPGVSDTQCGFRLFAGDVARAVFRKVRSGAGLAVLQVAKTNTLQFSKIPEIEADGS